MLGLVAGAALVITDSGGLQEETTFLGVPCLTVRPHTARPITCSHGTNRLVPPRGDLIRAAVERAVARHPPVRPMIERWDGRAAERVVQVLCDGERFPLEAAVASVPQFAHAGGAAPEPFATPAPIMASA
jgi:UDP-N-acetylglucosamine 2-epimerase